MPGKLQNLTRRAVVYNLTTKVAPVRHVFKRRTEHKDGTVRTVDRRLVLPDSVTVLAGKLSESLPDGVARCPEVIAAIARHDVKWIPDAVVEEPGREAPVTPDREGDENGSRRTRRRPDVITG